jgi:hypothetical protein
MLDWIDLDHLATYIMDFNGFNNFFYFYKLFLFNSMVKLDACKIEHEP